MNHFRFHQFKSIIAFGVVLGTAIAIYFSYIVVELLSTQALHQSHLLAKFNERAISRIRANPDIYRADSKYLFRAHSNNDKLNVVSSYTALKALFPSIPAEQDFTPGQVKAVVMRYKGIFKAPDYLLILPNQIASTTMFYSYLAIKQDEQQKNVNTEIFDRVQPALFVSLISILVLIGFELRHITLMNSSITDFSNWIGRLNANTSSPPPQFASSKFNTIAFAIDKNLSGISLMLEQEKSFAKFTSHELRTPIAVLSANMELLELMMKDLSPQERKILKNMESAVSDMKYQMEALLWLSRENESEIDCVDCNLSLFLEKVINDNSYLLHGKDLSIETDLDTIFVKTNPTFLQIILNNLVRNAYQNTSEGIITINAKPNTIIIENMNVASKKQPKTNAGFGLGLILVEKLTTKLNMDYTITPLPQGRRVQLCFNHNGVNNCNIETVIKTDNENNSIEISGQLTKAKNSSAKH